MMQLTPFRVVAAGAIYLGGFVAWRVYDQMTRTFILYVVERP